jgi:DNA-binding transcriptional MerR regulator
MDMSIGELARLTGLPVRTFRYYSDIGLAPEADRSPAGCRRYDEAALARIELVRTLRDLGLDLATIRQVLDRQAGLAEVALQLETFSDRRVERYWQLIGVINGWPSRPSLMPAYEWFTAALSAPR